jgi:magnesium-transporting ATPase (P-type)
LVNNDFKKVHWSDVKTGDIVKVQKGEKFPCDLVVLKSSEKSGVLYVETSSLDGEANLKIKKAKQETNKIKEDDFPHISESFIECEKPNKILYNFEGRLTLKIGSEDTIVGLDNDQVLLRGSSLRNTQEIYGMKKFNYRRFYLYRKRYKIDEKSIE